MTLLYHDPRFLDHDTGRHPECATRLVHVAENLQRLGLFERCHSVPTTPVSLERLSRIHAPQYAAAVAEFAKRGGGSIEADTVVSPASYDVGLLAAGAVCDAVQRVLRGEDVSALCLVRPPGHHALPAGAMGFCLFNNVALGACVARDEFQLDRVLIVDWDVHHGNGTQDVFWRDPRVGFFSIHRWPFYPGTGDADESGAGDGLGMTLNLPTQFGTPRSEYLARFSAELERFADRLRPQLVLISAGFDSHREDPIGSLGLETEDFAELTRAVLQVAQQHAAGRLVSVLEGGYNPAKLAECVATHLRHLKNF